MNCKKCGMPIMAGAKVCAVCGTPVEEAAPVKEVENVTPTIDNLPSFDNEPVVEEKVSEVSDVVETPSFKPLIDFVEKEEIAPIDEPTIDVSQVAEEVKDAVEAEKPAFKPLIDFVESPIDNPANATIGMQAESPVEAAQAQVAPEMPAEPSPVSAEAPVASTPVSETPAPAVQPKKKKNTFLIIIIVLVVLIALVAVLILTGGIKVNGYVSKDGTTKQFGNNTTTTTTTTTTTEKVTEPVVANAPTVAHYGYKLTLPSGYEVSSETYMDGMYTIVNKVTKSVLCYNMHNDKYETLISEESKTQIKATYETKGIKTKFKEGNVNNVNYTLVRLTKDDAKTLEYLLDFKGIGSMIVYVYTDNADDKTYNELVTAFVASATQDTANFANPSFPKGPNLEYKEGVKLPE